MIPVWVLAASLVGMAFNLAFAQILPQPDWSLALLLAALLAHRGAWVWVLPGACVHDAVLYWSLWGCLPFLALIPLMLPHLDYRLGPGLPQRLLMLLLATIPVFSHGWGMSAWLLTLGLCMPLWFQLAKYYEQAA